MKQVRSFCYWGVMMLTKSFREGFGDGFTSPFNLFISRPIERPQVASVERAWRNVAKLISDSAACEVKRIERARSKGRSKEKIR